MELSAEVLHATVDSIKNDSTHPAERRVHVRLPFRFKVKAIPYDDGVLGEPLQVWTRDICAGSIGLIYHKPIREGRRFIIRLSREEETPLLMLCTVRVCKQITMAVYNIGASFAEVAETAASSTRQTAAEHFQPELAIRVVPETTVPTDLTDEVRRISAAILG